MFGLMGVARMAGAGGAFSPLSLFAGGEVGAWYDPSDFSSMFQDFAGTTPVTAVEQPVGLILDKRLGLALGPELWANGDAIVNDFGGSVGAFNPATGVMSNSAAGSNPNYPAIYITLPSASAGTCYRVVVTSTDDAALTSVYITVASLTAATAGQINCILARGAGVQYLSVNFNGTSTFSTTITVSVREIAGNHATQPTAAARPVVSARKNWFTSTEDFTDAAWAASSVTKTASTLTYVTSGGIVQYGFPPIQGIAAGATLTLSITMSADTPQPIQLAIADNADGDPFYVLSINLTTTPTRFTFTQTMGAAFSGNLAVLIRGLGVIAAGTVVTVSEPQLEIGSTATAYQRVTTASDYDAVGFPHYIANDGIDDLLATTFPDLGTDVTIARAVPFVGASILTAQTIGAGVRNDSTNHAGLVIIDRALTAGETTALTAYLDAKAGV